MKAIMMHPPTNSSPAQDVTHPVRAGLATLDHFSSIGEFSRYSTPILAMHHHHIPHSPERSLITPSHSQPPRHLVGSIQYP